MGKLYTLGDAQIDAQNRTTEQIGDVLVRFDAMKAAGTLTASGVQSFMNEVQSLIDTYDAQYGSTKRGAGGRATLQIFVDNNIFPAWRDIMASLSTPTLPQSLISVPAIPNAQGGAGGYGTVTNINVSPGSSSTPISMGPSASPGPPSGLMIPGTEQTVNAPFAMPEWALPVAVGLALYFFFVKK